MMIPERIAPMMQPQIPSVAFPMMEAQPFLKKQKIEPPVFHSDNVDDGDEFNKTLFEKCKDQIHYM